MVTFIRQFFKILPSLLLAFVLAVAVWILAVTASDPTEERTYPRPVEIEIIGQDPALIITSEVLNLVDVNLSAPRSIWNVIINDEVPVRAILDLSGLPSGTHTIPIQIQVGISPVRITSYTPQIVNVTLEVLSVQELNIHLINRNEPAVGFQSGEPQLNQTTTTVTGPFSLVNRIQQVNAVLDYNQAHEEINRTINLQAVDVNGNAVQGITLSPDRVQVIVPITQRGGYRNVVVRPILTGQVASGYRLTTISVFPPTVTVYSPDPKLIEKIPGYVETAPLNINQAKDDLDISVNINLPDGIQLVGDQMVQVQISIAAIEGSLSLNRILINPIGLAEGFEANISPMTLDLIISGPLPMLDAISPNNIRVSLDLTGLEPGTFQITPKVELGMSELRLESVLPQSVEVTITASTPTPTVTP
jgi:YbbR domain-containing protein